MTPPQGCTSRTTSLRRRRRAQNRCPRDGRALTQRADRQVSAASMSSCRCCSAMRDVKYGCIFIPQPVPLSTKKRSGPEAEGTQLASSTSGCVRALPSLRLAVCWSQRIGVASLRSVHGAAGADHGAEAEGDGVGAVIIGATGSAGIAGGVHAGVAATGVVDCAGVEAGGVQAGVDGIGAVTWAGVDAGAVHGGVVGSGAEAAGTGGVATGALGGLALRTTLVDWFVA